MSSPLTVVVELLRKQFFYYQQFLFDSRPGGHTGKPFPAAAEKGAKSLVGNKDFRKHLKIDRGSVQIDPKKVQS